MAKAPSFQFYPGDWMKDPALSMCSPATRGIWADLLCVIHELNQGGTASGTAEQLARACRCSSVEFTDAADELSSTGTADVQQRGGRYTIHSRRMERDLQTRAEREAAGQAGGCAKRDNATIGKPSSKPPSKTVANHLANEEQSDKQNRPPSSSSSSSSSSSEDSLTHTHAREPTPLERESKAIREAIAFWNRYWSETHGCGKPDADSRIDAMLAQSRAAGWDDAKIADSIRASVGWNAKSWRDPEANHDELAKARASRSPNSRRAAVSLEDGR